MEIAGIGFMLVGLLFFLATVTGVHRFPDFYTRMHGAAKGDTLSSMLFIIGIILLSFEHFDATGFVRFSKLVFIIVFLFIASPAASHALISAGYVSGMRPWQSRSDTPEEGGETE